MPIATAEGVDDDAQGSVTLFLHENKDKHGNPSSKVFGVSNCHVLRERTTAEYNFKGPGAPRQCVRVAGLRRFQRGLTEIKGCIAGDGIDAELLTREIVECTEILKSDDPEEAAEAKAAVEQGWNKLTNVKRDIGARDLLQ